jgi:hypothetical protein
MGKIGHTISVRRPPLFLASEARLAEGRFSI